MIYPGITASATHLKRKSPGDSHHRCFIHLAWWHLRGECLEIGVYSDLPVLELCSLNMWGFTFHKSSLQNSLNTRQHDSSVWKRLLGWTKCVLEDQLEPEPVGPILLNNRKNNICKHNRRWGEWRRSFSVLRDHSVFIKYLHTNTNIVFSSTDCTGGDRVQSQCTEGIRWGGGGRRCPRANLTSESPHRSIRPCHKVVASC